ncbi:MAG TPA: FAD-binding protein, partial [Flavobacterium sp.]|nr:FAD-binding protein [Flavobacterium sp.]
MEIVSNYPLKKHNTFGINAYAKEFVQVHTVEELAQVIKENREKELFILGGGSNMLLTQDINALVIHIDLHGKDVVWQDEEHVHVRAMAGE